MREQIYSEAKQKPPALPLFSEELTKPRSGQRTLHALESLYRFRLEPDGYTEVFNRHPPNLTAVAAARAKWEKDRRCREAVATLVATGLLPRLDEPSSFLISQEPSGFFYITDRPDTGHTDEVFSLHLEQRALSERLLVGPEDRVLDLGTGCGILLLEAVRRGARGIGIDISKRALMFARANASLNNVIDRTTFEWGDMTAGPNGSDWGKPDVIISNPPFDPTLPGDSPPLHSASGTLGDQVLMSVLEVISRLASPPKRVQFVLYSLASDDFQQENSPAWLTPPKPSAGSRLHFWPILDANRKLLRATLEAREVARPMSVNDFLALHHGRKSRVDRSTWLRNVRMKLPFSRSIYIHLFVASFFIETLSRQGSSAMVWRPWRGAQAEECFILPTASQPSRNIRCDPAGRKKYKKLHESVRVSLNQGRMRLAGERTRVCFGAAVRECFPPGLDVVFTRVAESNRSEVLMFSRHNRTPAYFECSMDQLINLLKTRWTIIGATICDVFQTHPYVNTSLEAGSAIELVDLWEKRVGSSERFVAVSNWPDGCLIPEHQEIFANTILGSSFIGKDLCLCLA
jgi:SAM-dependent methyltransferase